VRDRGGRQDAADESSRTIQRARDRISWIIVIVENAAKQRNEIRRSAETYYNIIY